VVLLKLQKINDKKGEEEIPLLKPVCVNNDALVEA
jgi:hypothetical protein